MKILFNDFNVPILSLLLLLVFHVHSVLAQTTVLVKYPNADNTIQLTYAQPVRLEQVFNDVQNHQASPVAPIFWTGSALFVQHQDNELKQKKQSVITALEQLALQKERDQQSILSLKKRVLAVQLSKRIFQPLDPELIRIQPSLNPLLDGRYLLSLPSRPDSVLTLGAVKQPINILWQERADTNYYLNQAQVTTDANKDYAWVIQPDGEVQKHSIAYWNYQHRDIAPGAIVYLGIDGLPSKFNRLNQDIIQLLRNRVSE